MIVGRCLERSVNQFEQNPIAHLTVGIVAVSATFLQYSVNYTMFLFDNAKLRQYPVCNLSDLLK